MQRFIALVLIWVVILTACESPPENPSGPPTPTLTTDTQPTATIDTAQLISELPQVQEEPTFISVSQFPVAVIGAAGAQRPAYISVEMAGFDIAELTWQIGRYEEDCNRLLSMGQILPQDGESWPDGVHQASFSWTAAGFFIGDGERADFVYVQMNDSSAMIGGRFRSSSTGETVDANLLVDPAANRLLSLQTTAGQPLTPAPGDGFQLFDRCLAADDSIQSEPGVELIYLAGEQFHFDQRPLTTGDYFLHLAARNDENGATSRADFQVDNDFLLPDYQVYLNPEYGFQFLYPDDWQTPQLQNGRLVTGDDTTTQTVTIHPDRSGSAPADLKNLALSQFGNVTVLFEDQISIDNIGALWTAYGYGGADGQHTGILLTFIRDGVGFTVDMDGLQTAEEQTISLMNTFVENWLFRPDITGPRARGWTASVFDDLAMPVKTTYYQEELGNGWRRYAVGDGISFLAVRTEPLRRTRLSNVVEQWRDVAGRGVEEFAISEDYEFVLNGREWIRTDFAYVGEGSLQIQGFVVVTEIDDQAVVFWAEMPITRYEEQSAQFWLSLASLR